jgi:hypothetical protein
MRLKSAVSSAPMSHSAPTASTCARYLMSEPRRRTFTCGSAMLKSTQHLFPLLLLGSPG